MSQEGVQEGFDEQEKWHKLSFPCYARDPISSGKTSTGNMQPKEWGQKMKVIIIGIILVLLPVVSSASDRGVIVRDRYGNIVETKDRYGDDTTVRDRYGNITRTEEYGRHGGKTIRDSDGNIIGSEERD